MPRSIHHMLVLTATGLVLLGSTAALAETTDQRTDARSSDVRSGGLNGGFYDDKYKDDDWYFDFYETPKQTEDRTAAERSAADRKSALRPDVIRTSDKTQFVDAAEPAETHSSASSASSASSGSSTRSTQVSGFYYFDDPWYFQERDESYTMTSKPAPIDPSRSAQKQEKIKGNVTHVKQVRNTTRGGQNTVVQIKPLNGSPTIVDLGPTQPLLNMALTPGDTISVGGRTEHAGSYSVLMATQVKSGANVVNVNRQEKEIEGALPRREAEGRLERIMEVRVRGSEQKHSVAAIKSESGRMMLVDLGPATAGNIPAGTAPGDHVIASGPVATVGNYPVLFAERVSIANAAPIKVARPDGRYPGATLHDMEASQTLEGPQPKTMPQSQ